MQPTDLPPLPARIMLTGVPIDPVSEREAIERIVASSSRGVGGWVITANLDQLRLCHERPELRPMYGEAELVLADGMPLLCAARLQGTPLPERVAGSELIFTLSAAAARAGRSVFLLGGNPGTAEGAARELVRLNPGLRVAGTQWPPLGFEKVSAEMQSIEDRLRESRPDIVFVGLGFPKQERLIEQLRGMFPTVWFLGVGVSFSFVAGEIRRAPRWLQRVGLEWIHRMGQEPGRLFRRYVIHDLPFAVKLFASAAKARVKAR